MSPKPAPAFPSPLTTSSLTGVLPTPSFQLRGSFAVKATTTINAPAKVIYDTILDFDSYPTWNSYTPSVEFNGPRPTTISVGTKFTFEVHQKRGDSGIKSVEQVTLLEPGTTSCRIAWKSANAPAVILLAERVHEMTEVVGDDGKPMTTYTTWETFGGFLGLAVRISQGKSLVDRFADWTNDLKAHVEGTRGGHATVQSVPV